jgi:hypothetical protein
VQRAYLFFAAFFFPPLAFFAIENSSLHWWIAGSDIRRRTLPPGTSARHQRSRLVGRAPQDAGAGSNWWKKMKVRIKKWGARRAPRRFTAAELPLLRGLFLSALGSLLRHFFLLRLL